MSDANHHADIEANMAEPLAEVPAEQAGRAIAARRAFLGLSGQEINQRTGQLVYPKLLSRLETGKKHPAEMPIQRFLALASSLEWTPVELAEGIGIRYPQSGSVESGQFLRVPFFPNLHTAITAPDTARLMELPRSFVDLVREGGAGTMADGNLLGTHEARDRIPVGSVIGVHFGEPPAPGQIAVGWSNGFQLPVLWVHKLERAAVSVAAFDGTGPVHTLNISELDIRGHIIYVVRQP
jgi:hypothetical protein